MISRIWLVLLLAITSSSYKILVYNVRFGHSQSNFLGRIADILVEAGHNVTSLIPIVDPSAPNGTSKSRIIHVPQDKATKEFMHLAEHSDDVFWEEPADDLLGALALGGMMKGWFCSQCEATLNHPGLMEQLTAENFDVLINENFDYCGMGLAHAIKPKATIVVSTTTLFDNVAYDLGIPVLPSFNPTFTTASMDIHSIWSRAKNVYRTYLNNVMFDPALHCANDIYRKKYGDSFPDLRDLTGQAAYVFTNSEPLIDFARPLLRKVVDLGGVFLKEPKQLDENWDKILTLRKKTVLLSFGSVAKSVKMSNERKHAVLKALTQFPDVTFIWKYEEPEDDFAKEHAAKVKNIVMKAWTPQHDLLGDPRLTAFVSHSGMASCQEAAARGVPGLYIPIFGDQPRNAAMMEYSGIGIAFDKVDAADADKFADGIRRLLETESLHKNAKRISAMLAVRPFSPRDILVKHVEFAAEFGPSPALTPRGLQLGWIQYFLIDIIAIVLTVGVLIFVLVVCTISRLLKKCTFMPMKTKQS